MSLVLEALKKLEREKGKDERGFLVMTAAPWPAPAARRWPLWVAAGVGAGVAAALALRLAGGGAAPAPVTPPGAPASGAAAPGRTGPAAEVRPEPAARTAAAGPLERGPGAEGGRAARAVPLPAAAAAEPGRLGPPPAPAAAPSPAEAGHGLRLQAISERDGQPIAIVSDRLVRVGDEWDGVRVLAIREAEVEIEVRGRRSTLRF